MPNPYLTLDQIRQPAPGAEINLARVLLWSAALLLTAVLLLSHRRFVPPVATGNSDFHPSFERLAPQADTAAEPSRKSAMPPLLAPGQIHSLGLDVQAGLENATPSLLHIAGLSRLLHSSRFHLVWQGIDPFWRGSLTVHKALRDFRSISSSGGALLQNAAAGASRYLNTRRWHIVEPVYLPALGDGPRHIGRAAQWFSDVANSALVDLRSAPLAGLLERRNQEAGHWRLVAIRAHSAIASRDALAIGVGVSYSW